MAPFVQTNSVDVSWKLGLGHEPLVMAQKPRPQWDLIHTGQMRAPASSACRKTIPSFSRIRFTSGSRQALTFMRVARQPPSTPSTSPLTKDASSEQRNATTPATSAGFPVRPSGVPLSIRSR